MQQIDVFAIIFFYFKTDNNPNYLILVQNLVNLHRLIVRNKKGFINKTHQIFAVVAAESDVEELVLLPQLPEARADVRLEVVPPSQREEDVLVLRNYFVCFIKRIIF